MTSDKPKFSIVLAAYNVEFTILFTLGSLEAQSFKDYEVIVINDKSTDNTDNLIQSFLNATAIDKIIYIKNIKNTGLSEVRNLGISKASGEYLLFLDGDDAYHFDSLYLLNQRINNFNIKPEALFFSAATFLESIDCGLATYEVKNYAFNKGYNRIDLGNQLVEGLNWLKVAVENNTYFDNACLILIKKEFLLKNNIKFVPGLIFEDTLFTREILINSKKISISDDLILLRRIAEGSIMRSPLTNAKIKSRFYITKCLLHKYWSSKDKFFYSDSLKMLLINLKLIKNSDYLLIKYIFDYSIIFFFYEDKKVRNLILNTLKIDLKKILGYTHYV